jgi:hypothetical protein
MYVMVVLLIMGSEYKIHAAPLLFESHSSCHKELVDYEKVLEKTKPSNGSYSVRCIQMNTSSAAAPLVRSGLIADSRS